MQNIATPKIKRLANTVYTFLNMQRVYKVFFETYAMERRMTKEERAHFLELIGEDNSRNFTYRLQNHKHRLAKEMLAYRRLVEEGRVNSYESFLTYCFNNHVPELESPGFTISSLSLDDPFAV